MPAGSVAAYQAALESTTTQMSYAMESTWATLPATQFQGMRIVSENLKHTKTRTRPGEIRGDRQAAPALTTQEGANGSIVFPVFFAETGKASQFDDFLSALLGGDWQTPTTITGAAGDIALTSGGALTSTTSGKFTGILVGQVIKLNGFTNTINNGFYRVGAVVSPQSLTLVPQGFTPVTETPSGTAAKVYYSGLRSGTFFKSIYGQQRLDPAGTKWFRYPGMYPTKGSITLQLGQFMQASFDMAVQQELKGTGDASTGGIVAPPSTRVMDPVAGFKGAFWNDALIATGVGAAGFDLTNEGADGERFLGSPLAQGMLGGTFMAAATAQLAFKDFTLYDLFRAETAGIYSVEYGDQQGNRYIFSIPNATLMFNDGANVEGPNRMIMANASIEANPDTATATTLLVDRFPATA